MARELQHLAAACLLAVMFVLAGGAALRESPAVDEIAHIGAGLSYLQRLDLRLNLYAIRLGGAWGGLLCLACDATTPAFLVFGPLVITDLPVTLFSLIAVWQLGELWALPSRRNALFFGVALAAALLSKFTGVLLFLVILTLFIQTRFWATAAEPGDPAQRKASQRTGRLLPVVRASTALPSNPAVTLPRYPAH
jgi:hypothetical protein